VNHPSALQIVATLYGDSLGWSGPAASIITALSLSASAASSITVSNSQVATPPASTGNAGTAAGSSTSAELGFEAVTHALFWSLTPLRVRFCAKALAVLLSLKRDSQQAVRVCRVFSVNVCFIGCPLQSCLILMLFL
jgi:hypothetical protein